MLPREFLDLGCLSRALIYLAFANVCVHTVRLSIRDNKGANNCIDTVYALWF